MARKSAAGKKAVKTKIEAAMPGMQVVEDAATATTADTARSKATPGPSIEKLKSKLGGVLAADAAKPRTQRAKAKGDVQVVKVRSKRTPADPADDPGPRTVIYSKQHGIQGSQG